MDTWKNLTQKRIDILQEIINTHNKYKNSYLWNLTYTHQSFINEISFIYKSNEYYIKQQTNPSRKYLYYSLEIFINNNKKDIRVIKKLIN